MPLKSKSTSIAANVLKALKQSGAESQLLLARLQWVESAQLLTHYLKPLIGVERVFPTMLPTQASGRWSTKNPPRVNTPDKYQDTVWPDPGTYWIKWDYDAIEAKLATALCRDEEDLTAFRENHDIHTLTACKALGLPMPPIRTKALNTAPECAEWREQVQWAGPKDNRRDLFKVARYALTYAYDETGLLNARGVEELGVTRAELLKMGKLFLRSKPHLVAWKKATWAAAYKTREARTFLGRRRRLFSTQKEINLFAATGRPGDAAKEGLNHAIQGAVADVLNLAIIAISTRWPECYLVLNAHDSATFAFPAGVEAWPEIRGLVEQKYEISPGMRVTFTGEWWRTDAGGARTKLK